MTDDGEKWLQKLPNVGTGGKLWSIRFVLSPWYGTYCTSADLISSLYPLSRRVVVEKSTAVYFTFTMQPQPRWPRVKKDDGREECFACWACWQKNLKTSALCICITCLNWWCIFSQVLNCTTHRSLPPKMQKIKQLWKNQKPRFYIQHTHPQPPDCIQ